MDHLGVLTACGYMAEASALPESDDDETDGARDTYHTIRIQDRGYGDADSAWAFSPLRRNSRHTDEFQSSTWP